MPHRKKSNNMSQRLLDKFEPSNYAIKLNIDRQSKTIEGQSTITGNIKEDHFAVNQKYMSIDDVKVNGEPVDFKVDDKRETIEIHSKAVGQADVAIVFHTQLTDSMMGIYPSYYKVNGEAKELIGTQFETTAARQAFPCVDEPAAKAKFTLAIKFDEQPGETIIANTPEEKLENGYHYFKQTVKMSTYLIAFAFGDLQKKLTQTQSGVKIGVFATKAHKPKELDFALDIAKRAIEFYEDFYQTPYPLDHSWQLALPDFSAGAMENWGLVTYREAYLLLDPDNTTLANKQLVATVITHELAHQWFGDLVTMNWWDDLWLNESFANMMEYLSVNAIKPEWHVWEMFQTSEVPMALQRDAVDGVQPVHVEVENPAEIDSIFDAAIVYAKGSRMLVMVRSLLGDDALRKGLREYFKQHKYANAKGDDLWDALADASGMNIGDIMHSWLNQPGYPVVSASIVNGHLKLHQQQFFIGDGKDQGRLWKIPLNANYDVAPQIMDKADLDLGDYAKLRQQNNKPFRLNVGNNSHFIVKYDQTLLNDILDHVNDLDNIAQLQQLQDLRLLAEGRQISYASLVPLLTKFSDSQSNIVNAALYQIANSLKKFVTPGTDLENNLRQFFNQLSESQISRLGLEPRPNDNNDDQLTRPIILNASLYGKNHKTIESAHQLFEKASDLMHIPASIRPYVLASEVENQGSDKLFTDLCHQYQEAVDPGLKQDLCFAITKFTSPDLLQKLVNKFEDAQFIKPQDLRAWYRGVLANPSGQQIAWDWLRNDWSWLNETVGGDMEFATYITVTASIFHTVDRLNEFKEFFDPKINTPGLTREITMDRRIIASRVELVENEKNAVNAAVEKQVN